ncbi:carbon-nitrogen hydrolase family protein [Rhodoferax sp. TS-BS-61-7]|uniref:carbon-nitrogen hydrolase family protein n=1 Tax=Rhodoferax sp. TS-BS-61-7 TaxID=2094194 RepID=UPI00191BDBD6|nr:carbon-nitrogen hydrolase family protein [Rhodoferax sp. TS-BS-61-7]
MRTPLTLALLQCAPAPLDVAGNLQRLDQAAQQAAAAGAQVLVCPEMFISGYAIGAAAVQQLAQPADGAWAQAVAAIAQRHHIAVVYGYPEQDASGAVFNAAQWISAQGQRCLSYRKTYLFGDLDSNQFAAGAPSAATFMLQGWTIGLLICYDVEFPEATRRLALAGADLIVVPTANMPAYDFVAQALVPVRAYENQMYVAYANYMGAEGDVHYGGLSLLAAPDGQAVAQADRQPTLLIATLDDARLSTARAANRHVRDAAALPPHTL